MGFFGKIWDGIKNIGQKVKEGTKWLGQKAKDIYAKGKEIVENNPVIQKVWNTLRNIEIPKLGISAGSLMDTIKGTAEAAHDTITGSGDVGDVLSGIRRTVESTAPVIPKAREVSERMGRYTDPASIIAKKYGSDIGGIFKPRVGRSSGIVAPRQSDISDMITGRRVDPQDRYRTY
jgi:hypothetical protein